MTAPAPKRGRGNPNLVKGGPSLNPKGRPKGSKNALTEIQNELIREFADELNKDFKKVIRKVVKEAVNGDMTAAKMLLDRAIPARKAVEHYGAHDSVGGINIIISGTGHVAAQPTNSPVEGEFTEIESHDERETDD